LLFLIILGCNNRSKIFSEFERQYPKYHLDSLIISDISKTETFIDYTLTSFDSTKLLSFAYMIKSNPALNKGNIYFGDYQEKHIVGDTIYVCAYDENRKLLYSFKHTKNRYSPANDAIFLKGRYFYYYKYYYGQLNVNQKQYYELHEDSILNNYVNEIPLMD